ncbi:hypothetical protein SO802_027724 [Lithocarpus litseifolius]|uniref:Uncharacterized protein n=1 Tax=Lithocarpus litseifolius TaxID=425828 RepID=A0AAW2C3D2_9ROSI
MYETHPIRRREVRPRSVTTAKPFGEVQYIEDLALLAQLKLVSLDLYECPVTRVKDYRSRVFGLIKSLKYLDKMDAEENERPESDGEEEDKEDDPGSGEIDGEDRPFGMNNGHNEGVDGVVDVDEDEESDADKEETETARRVNGSNHQANGFIVERVEGGKGGKDEDEGDDDEDNELGEEIDDDDDVVEVHEIDDGDDEEEPRRK